MASNEDEKASAGYLNRIGKLVSGTAKATAVKIGEGLSGLVSLRSLLLAGIILFLLHLFDFIAIPFWPFTTTGTIYVDSPEVYTRERLVNDRYDQDYWLHGRLEKLDKPEELHLIVGEEFQSAAVGAGEDVGKRGKDDSQNESDPARAKAPRHLSFEQEFGVASGIRDMIRQRILENMLDDRHDLTGNSVYGLKFDTTVIPGTNTHRYAFVHVCLPIENVFSDEGSKAKGLGECIDRWDGSRIDAQKKNRIDDKKEDERQTLRRQTRYYNDWLTDIAKRLNRAEDSVYESMNDKCPPSEYRYPRFTDTFYDARYFYDKLTSKTLEIVLGIPEERFWYLNPPHSIKTVFEIDADSGNLEAPVKLPEPWDRFFQIQRKKLTLPDETLKISEARREQSCGYRVWFEVDALHENFVVVRSAPSHAVPIGLFEAGALEDEHLVPLATTDSRKWKITVRLSEYLSTALGEEGQDSLIPLGETEDKIWDIYVSDWEYGWRSAMFEKVRPKYQLTSRFIERQLEVKKEKCRLGIEAAERCETNRRVDLDVVHSGFFNFLDSMSKRDAYSYAVFPKNDVVGIFVETAAQLSAVAPATGFLDLARRLTETRTAPVLVGFGDGRRGDRFIEFGWIISPRGGMDPMQKNQLALVSVPAWKKILNLHVSVGWINRHGVPEIDESFDLNISVPPTLDAFDSIFREDAQVTLGPSIRDNEMDRDIYVRAGKETKILIPGSRLWRSASVTLGAQMAKRIRVLPNMEGIIAEFGPVDPPYAAYNVESDPTGNQSGEGSEDQADNEPEGVESEECKKRIKFKFGEDKVERNLGARAVRLRVWTSEGVALADKPICVVYDPDEVLSEAPKGSSAESTANQGKRGMDK